MGVKVPSKLRASVLSQMRIGQHCYIPVGEVWYDSNDELFISECTIPMADVATSSVRVSRTEDGFFVLYPKESKIWYKERLGRTVSVSRFEVADYTDAEFYRQRKSEE